MKTALTLLLATAPAALHAQASPTASIPVLSNLRIPKINGNLQYGLSLSELLNTGYPNANGGSSVTKQTSISGDVGYTNRSETAPFSMIYTGGVQVGTYTGTFQTIALSQGWIHRGWSLNATDVASYLPQSPTVGLSGIPGTGDLGLAPIVGGGPSQNILSLNSNRVSNNLSGSASRALTSRTSLSAGASYGKLYFFGDSGGLDSDQISANVTATRRIDARTSVNVSGIYSQFSFGIGDGSVFKSEGATVGVQRQLRRDLTFNASAGPQWINAAPALGIPSSLNTTVSLGLSLSRRIANFSVNYFRGVNGGSGAQAGALSDSVTATASRAFGINWATSLNLGYNRSRSLSDAVLPLPDVLGFYTNSNFSTLYVGAQASRRISRPVSVYASYTASDQSYGNQNGTQNPAFSPNVLNGLVQSFAFGISYSPRSLHLGQFQGQY